MTDEAVAQTIGGAFLVSAAQSAFTNTLISSLKTNASTIDPMAVIAAGASGLRDRFVAGELPGILVSYVEALRVTFAIAIAAAGLSALTSGAVRWISIKGEKVDVAV